MRRGVGAWLAGDAQDTITAGGRNGEEACDRREESGDGREALGYQTRTDRDRQSGDPCQARQFHLTSALGTTTKTGLIGQARSSP